MENPPFEDVFTIEHGDIPLLCYVSLEGMFCVGGVKEQLHMGETSLMT